MWSFCNNLHGAHFGLLLQSSVSLLGNSKPDTLALGQGHMWLVGLANDEDVTDTRGKLMASVVFHMDNVK